MKRFLSICLVICISLLCMGCGKVAEPLGSLDTDSDFSSTASITENIIPESDIYLPTTTSVLSTSSESVVTSSPESQHSSSNHNTPAPSSSNPSSVIPSSQPDEPKDPVILPEIIDTYQEEYRPNYMLGNCRNLKGNPLVVLLFIDDDESSWSAEQVTEYTNKHVNVGLQYLEDKAKEWNVDLNFTVKSYSTPLSEYTLKYEGSVIRDLRISGSSKDVLDQAARDMGYPSNWELYSKFKTEHGGNDDVIFLTFINKAGKSYTRHFISTGRTSYSEHCVLFSDYLEGDSFGCRASTVAHELLHLFGAEDFYNGYREFLAYQIYPKDIMLWMPTDAYENEIGDFTAYTLGWTDTIPQICYNEYWWK